MTPRTKPRESLSWWGRSAVPGGCPESEMPALESFGHSEADSAFQPTHDSLHLRLRGVYGNLGPGDFNNLAHTSNDELGVYGRGAADLQANILDLGFSEARALDADRVIGGQQIGNGIEARRIGRGIAHGAGRLVDDGYFGARHYLSLRVRHG